MRPRPNQVRRMMFYKSRFLEEVTWAIFFGDNFEPRLIALMKLLGVAAARRAFEHLSQMDAAPRLRGKGGDFLDVVVPDEHFEVEAGVVAHTAEDVKRASAREVSVAMSALFVSLEDHGA